MMLTEKAIAPEAALPLSGERILQVQANLRPTPPVTLAAAHVYPAAAPAFERAPHAERRRTKHELLRLYAHIPFCNYKCNFCFYATRVGDDWKKQEAYVAALERELEWVEPGSRLSQLFMGGGTPTVLHPELLDRALNSIFTRLPPTGESVHTVEASPESVTDAHVAVLRAHGIGRVSMGVQSLDDPVLADVHRRQARAQVLEACERITGAGLILNVDLMYGLPGQSRDGFARDAQTITAAGAHSLTLYDLRTNESAPIAKSLRDEERLDLEHLVHWRAHVSRVASELGYTQTRWHTHKRLDSIAAEHERAPCFDEQVQGFQLGIGMSARSHLGTTMYKNHERMGEYMRRVNEGRSPVEYVFELGEEDLRTQFIARTLGDGRALVHADYERAFGTHFHDDYAEPLARLQNGGLVVDDGDGVVLSDAGRLLYDRVMLQFYPDHALAWLEAQDAARR